MSSAPSSTATGDCSRAGVTKVGKLGLAGKAGDLAKARAFACDATRAKVTVGEAVQGLRRGVPTLHVPKVEVTKMVTAEGQQVVAGIRLTNSRPEGVMHMAGERAGVGAGTPGGHEAPSSTSPGPKANRWVEWMRRGTKWHREVQHHLIEGNGIKATSVTDGTSVDLSDKAGYGVVRHPAARRLPLPGGCVPAT